MWDMKPQAPAEIRGEFKPISTSVPGLQVCEHLPRLAKRIHHGTLIRSAHHSVNNSHAAAVYVALTGHDRGEAGGGTKSTDHPAIGSVVGKIYPPTRPVLPYVSLPYITKEGRGRTAPAGLLRRAIRADTRPAVCAVRDPNAVGFRIEELSPPAHLTAERLTARQGLLRSLSSGSALSAFLVERRATRSRPFSAKSVRPC